MLKWIKTLFRTSQHSLVSKFHHLRSAENKNLSYYCGSEEIALKEIEKLSRHSWEYIYEFCTAMLSEAAKQFWETKQKEIVEAQQVYLTW